jgi:hypothetical protein
MGCEEHQVDENGLPINDAQYLWESTLSTKILLAYISYSYNLRRSAASLGVSVWNLRNKL